MTEPTEAGGEAEGERPDSIVTQVVSRLVCLPLSVAREAFHVGGRAVDDYRGWLDRRLAETFPEVEAALRGLGVLPGDTQARRAADEPDETPTAVSSSGSDTSDPVRDAEPIAAAPPPAPGPGDDAKGATQLPAAASGPAVPVEELAIPDYDSLSASQVVPRLDGLTVPELELVRRYEEAGRGRRTILSKIAQLQG